QAGLTRDSVLFTYSGVRPLPYAPEGSEGSISRSHVVFDHAKGASTAGGKLHKSVGGGPKTEGLLSIIGGKLTTYRNLSRQTVDKVFEKLRLPAVPSTTHRLPLPGGQTSDFGAFRAEFKTTSGLTDDLSERLLKLYGARAPEVVALAGDDPSLKMPLSPNATVETALIGAEIIHAFENELAETLSDALLRRAMVGLGPRVGLDVDAAAANVAAKHLGWTQQKTQREVENYREYIRRYRPREMERSGGITPVVDT
ncbi:MAG: glycerol-3-phosphate dehydrogenase C-terminal domain-containing protein, partial [Rubrobacteraceae bacterium]